MIGTVRTWRAGCSSPTDSCDVGAPGECAGYAGFDPHPLRPADTSSPRDALRSSWLTFDALAQERSQGRDLVPATARAYRRAAETLDLQIFAHVRCVDHDTFAFCPGGGRDVVPLSAGSFVSNRHDRLASRNIRWKSLPVIRLAEPFRSRMWESKARWHCSPVRGRGECVRSLDVRCQRRRRAL